MVHITVARFAARQAAKRAAKAAIKELAKRRLRRELARQDRVVSVDTALQEALPDRFDSLGDLPI